MPPGKADASTILRAAAPRRILEPPSPCRTLLVPLLIPFSLALRVRELP